MPNSVHQGVHILLSLRNGPPQGCSLTHLNSIFSSLKQVCTIVQGHPLRLLICKEGTLERVMQMSNHWNMGISPQMFTLQNEEPR